MTFEEWWDSNEFMTGHFLRMEIKEIARLAWGGWSTTNARHARHSSEDAPHFYRPHRLVPIEEKD